MPAPDTTPGDPRGVVAALLAVVACAIFLTFIMVQAQPRAVHGRSADSVALAPLEAEAQGSGATPTSSSTLSATDVVTATGAIVAPSASSQAPLMATATVTATAALSTTAPLTSTLAIAVSPEGTGDSAATQLHPPAPFFTFGRAFSPQHGVEASRYYPYGTDGRGEYLLHYGVDIGNAMGTPVLAIGDGEVVYAGDDIKRLWGPDPNFYGNVIVIRHPGSLEGQPIFSLYGHLSSIDVAAGQSVKAGDAIGKVGMAGIALGPHLHLEIRLGDAGYDDTRNSELFLAPLAGRGTIVGRAVDANGKLVPKVRVAMFGLDAAGKAKYIGETRSYPAQGVHPTVELGENFLFADIPAGRYRLVADRPVNATTTVTVTDGVALGVELGR